VIEFYYVHDPLCGWCYAMQPAVDALRQSAVLAGHSLVTLNAILWGGSAARIMAAGFRDHLNRGMPLVERASSVRFGKAFREKIVADDHYVYESGSAARALQVVKLHAPARDADYIKRIQTAFFVDGESASDLGTHTKIAEGLGIPPRIFVEAYHSDGISRAVQAERVRARSEMAALGANGVPIFFVRHAGVTVRIAHESARGPAEFVECVKAALQRVAQAGAARQGAATS
jgi:putative protein-disulfide isomerase